MKIINNGDTPDVIVEAMQRMADLHDYIPADGYRTTDLLKPPRMLRITREKIGELEKTVDENLNSFMGTCIHRVIEDKEANLCAKYSGWNIYGTPDIIKNNTIIDLKFCRVWSIIFGSGIQEWTPQLNIYRWLCFKNDIEINKLEVYAMMGDWMQSKSKTDASYPQHRTRTVPIEMWSIEDTEKYIQERIELHEAAKKELPECNAEERWETPTKWAVMKTGRKTAVKLFDSQGDAAIMVNQTPQTYLEERKGSAKRCDYCDASKYCLQHLKEVSDENKS